MLEIQVYNDNLSSWESLDIFKGEIVDLTIPIFSSYDLDSAIVGYSDSFDLPSTSKNLSKLLNKDSIKGRLKSKSSIIYGEIIVNSIKSYTPDGVISVQFTSSVKSAMDKMKGDYFYELFDYTSNEDSSEFIVTDYFDNEISVNDKTYGVSIRDGGFSFHNDELMKFTASNFVDQTKNASTYEFEGDYPIYMIDSKLGARSVHPTFSVDKLIQLIFNHYGFTVDICDNIVKTIPNNELGIRIPTQLLAPTTDRTITFEVSDALGGYMNNIQVTQIQPSDINKLFDWNGIETINSYAHYAIAFQAIGDYIINSLGGIMQFSDVYLENNFIYTLRDLSGVIQPLVNSFVRIPSSAITIVNGDIKPCIRFTNNGQEFDKMTYGANVLNSKVTGSIDAADDVEFRGEYGDLVGCNLLYYANNLIVNVPEYYYLDTDTWGGSQALKIINGYIEQDVKTDCENPITIEIRIADPITYGYVVNGQQTSPRTPVNLVTDTLEYLSGEGEFEIVPKNEYEIPRYGEKIDIYNSYKSTDYKVFDILENIIKRFFINIYYDGDKFILRTEPKFYSDDLLVIDNKVSEGIVKEYEYSKIKTISFLNEDYGNIYDKTESDKSVFDIELIDTGIRNGDEFSFNFNSCLQSLNVYGEKITVSDSMIEFLKLKNDTELWNFSRNEKIEYKALPITYGVMKSGGQQYFRIPRSVAVTADNYPNGDTTYIADQENLQVVEHTEFLNAYIPYWYLDGNELSFSDRNGSIDKASNFYDNVKFYIGRTENDTSTIECEAYLTNEDVLRIVGGCKIHLFGIIYKPIKLSNINFEKSGSIATILMTEYIEESSITFDSDTISFDSDTVTWDMI